MASFYIKYFQNQDICKTISKDFKFHIFYNIVIQLWICLLNYCYSDFLKWWKCSIYLHCPIWQELVTRSCGAHEICLVRLRNWIFSLFKILINLNLTLHITLYRRAIYIHTYIKSWLYLMINSFIQTQIITLLKIAT